MVENNLAFKLHCCFNKKMFRLKKFKALQNQLNISIEKSRESITLSCQLG